MLETKRIRTFSKNDNIGIIIGTGPSLTLEQIEKVSHLKKFGCNRAFEFDLDVLAATNKEFWDYYWPEIKDLRCDKWTPYKPIAEKYGINYIEERNEPGLSTNPAYIHHHHGSGPIILNIALHYGITKMLLIGWDMRFPVNGKRHYFGEYAKPMQHFTKNLGLNGEILGLIKEMETINPADYGIEIINCTKNSALTHFPMGSLEDHI